MAHDWGTGAQLAAGPSHQMNKLMAGVLQDQDLGLFRGNIAHPVHHVLLGDTAPVPTPVPTPEILSKNVLLIACLV